MNESMSWADMCESSDDEKTSAEESLEVPDEEPFTMVKRRKRVFIGDKRIDCIKCSRKFFFTTKEYP